MTDQSESAIPQCPNVLLSIEPEHADAILSGDKLYEYRRVAPARGPVLRLVLYASSPEQAAIGTAWVHTVKEDEPEDLVEETVGSTPHTKEDVLDYFEGADTGYALRIDAYYRFDDPVPIENLEAAGHKPSQNFRYLGNVPQDPEAVDAEAVVPGMEMPDSETKLATDGGTEGHEAGIGRSVIIEKRCHPIGDADPTDTSATFEAARDSWPKLLARETSVYGMDGDAVIYRGPADPKLYDSEDVEMMNQSDTVTVIKS